jgi:hypothetical protein
MPVTVMNLETQKKQTYSCTPEEAVVSAYAQNLNDWNTWEYETRYNHLVMKNESVVLCGNFSAFVDGRTF